ncbi:MULTISPECIES: nitroreductase family protein [Mesorhizobium]|uniref:nitroreductase family protein n=1 Tax=Mesorhizobium australicum TaxID=536018 RepID=UPI003338F4F4
MNNAPCPCLILLYARLDRTMWKHGHANAYRVVLIEAGHIGQNMMLAATRHCLSACPTAALSHSAVKRLLSLDRLTDPPIQLTLSTPELDTAFGRSTSRPNMSSSASTHS